MRPCWLIDNHCSFDNKVILRDRSANFISDAHIFMDPSSYANTAARHLYNEVRFMLNQSPQYIGLNIDRDKFFEAISYSIARERHTTSRWEYALPSRHDDGVEAAVERINNMNNRWMAYSAKAASVVPWCFMKSAEVRDWLEKSRQRQDGDIEMDGVDHGEESIEYLA
jgi:hypothetical protein